VIPPGFCTQGALELFFPVMFPDFCTQGASGLFLHAVHWGNTILASKAGILPS
jgi:hypothetical protein